ncbi:hypothetical protein GN956_G19641 [Arapaima gigas]
MDYLHYTLGLFLLASLAEGCSPWDAEEKLRTCCQTIIILATSTSIFGFMVIVLLVILLRRKIAQCFGRSHREQNDIQVNYMKNVGSALEEDAPCGLHTEPGRAGDDDDSTDDSSSTSSESSDGSVHLPAKDDYVNLSQGGKRMCSPICQGLQDYVNVFVPRCPSDSEGKQDGDTVAPVETDSEDSEDSEDNEVNYTTIVFN